MKDRVVTKPGKRKITPEGGGTPYYAVIERADEPVENGTPLNAANLLSDSTAEKLGLSGDNATPNNAIYKLANEKASLDSPKLIGTPTAPTPTAASGDTQIATKKYVQDNAGFGTLEFVQRFTSNGSFNPLLAANISKGNRYVFKIQGGGGGSARYTGTPEANAGGGGGAFLEVELIATSSVPIVVGTGGTSGSGAIIIVTGSNGNESSVSYSGRTYAARGGTGGNISGSGTSINPGYGSVSPQAYSGYPEIIMSIPGQHGSGGRGGNSAFGYSEGVGSGYGFGGTSGGGSANAGGGGCVEVYRYV